MWQTWVLVLDARGHDIGKMVSCSPHLFSLTAGGVWTRWMGSETLNSMILERNTFRFQYELSVKLELQRHSVKWIPNQFSTNFKCLF